MILVFPSTNFLTELSRAVLLYSCLSFTYCLVCVLQPCGHLLGKGLRPPSWVQQVHCLLDPLFLAECAFRRVYFSSFGSVFFELTSDFIQSCDNLLKHSERCACLPRCQQQMRRLAYADAQSDQRLCCSISGKYK